MISVSIQMFAVTIGATPVLAAPFHTNGSQSPTADGLGRVVVPSGAQQCPSSGLGASCSTGAPVTPDQGLASLPAGVDACASDPTKPSFGALGACPTDPAASPVPTPYAGSGSASPSPLTSSTPAAVDQPQSTPNIDLSADKTTLAAGDSVRLAVSTSIAVSGSPWVVELFDQTSQTEVGSCAQTGLCQVDFAAAVGAHTFVAYLAVPSSTIPVEGIRLQSQAVTVQWLGVSLVASDPSVVGPGKPVTFTATASTEVRKIGYQVELVDITAGQRLTYCSQGTACSTSLIEPVAGTHAVVADLIVAPVSFGSQPILEQSAQVSATWLSVSLTASPYSQQGGTTTISATTNADLANTPWAIFILRTSGELIGGPCVLATCAVTLTLPSAGTPSFLAVVARKDSVIRGSSSLARLIGQVQLAVATSDIQARSAVVTPIRMMWGVDSCAAFTQDSAGSTGLLPKVIAMLGAPDFWARYLPTTGECPALSTTEVAAARAHQMGILPIYNDYDCSAVSGAAAGATYAASAVQIAAADLIPLGTGIAIDIEPPGDACPGAANVDAGFITAWHDGITAAGYVPIYYGNTSAGSEFGTAWCAAVGQRPEIATTSFLWTFEPDLLGGFTKNTAPGYAPNNAGCDGRYDAWQYRISDGSTPDVDHDEATNRLPIWYP
jgi:hypothetical protein